MEDNMNTIEMINEEAIESEEIVAADNSGIGKVIGVCVVGVVVGGVAVYKFIIKPAAKKAGPIVKKAVAKLPWSKKADQVEVELVVDESDEADD